ncbi:glycyl-tRNA synthetase beta subunit [Enterococcus haemoperoxidus ATCC BAA-382]|uniref:Glycine--tRNA ligase beta subunit n=1 Tax=Enterococcus haemoperoxidus ATCC BAA-382 TaxID=1158608 RepID=R2QWU9_9ENTE|nr:glycine--tRNA ligase subunit beta [Enterococcus haemoperoxidus]EOH99843.1 glycyl-tRNA synthetase beta subunit [Enterococcus haemoperoxidus ATCC BAA-382]EOT62415.1 glycyl-tRNA synthetase beta subunit [Enterococcus haemoperoxidus ATCC BAA-382]OJG54271.1 glycyl-tRNA synthetase beta subunit [Enterococcus haemoperoxidus]
MAKDLLLEIGLEEMPAHIVSPSRLQLENKIVKFLDENKLTYGIVQSFSTPRRLAIRVTGLPEQQEDTQEEVKGPAKKIAQDAEGNWSKAAEGFVRGQGLTTEAITFKELNGVEYVYVTKHNQGQKTIDVLAGLKDVITSLTFPVTMHWANYDFEYIRPIHWIVALLDDEVIPFSVLDVTTGNRSRGHRFLGDDVTFDHSKEYEEKLKAQFVIVDPNERKKMIVDQANQLAEKNSWKLDLDENLLEEVNNLVEYPTAFVGAFDEKYLSVPDEVLVTSMKEHQRYFDVRNDQGLLLPHFISVRNGDNVHIENVIKGNEKVLIARLEDAEFFYNEDKKLSIEECVNKLKNVTFHEKIGTIYEKMQRVAVIGQIIGKEVGLLEAELADLKRASEIYKFDLVTNMVGEFPELQGIMGEKYALLQGEKPAVAQAIREHYLPTSSEGELPVSAMGAVLAIADKLDSVFSFFAVGMIPSGSNDPYALRRQTYGVIRIVENKGWQFPLVQLQMEIDAAVNADSQKFGIQLTTGQEEVIEFVKARLRQLLMTKDVRHDVIDAVISSEQKDLAKLFSSAAILKKHLLDNDFKPSMEALTRVINLAKKGRELLKQDSQVDATLFENNAEKALHKAVNEIEEKFDENTMSENYQALVNLRPLIEQYFEETMVMVEDEKVKANRLQELNRIAKMSLSLASLDLLIVK